MFRSVKRSLGNPILPALLILASLGYLFTIKEPVPSEVFILTKEDLEAASLSFVSSQPESTTRFNLPELPKDACKARRSVVVSSFAHPYRIYLHDEGRDVYVSDSVAIGSTTGNYFESDIRDAMTEALKGQEQAVIFDIGANIGIYTLYFASLGHIVHAFEPTSHSGELLKCSVVANRFDNVRVNSFGLSNEESDGCIQIPNERNQGGATLGTKSDEKGNSCQFPVKIRRLSDYLDENPGVRPFMIKIDIEGFEYVALSTAKEFFKKHPPKHIFSEVTDMLIRRAGVKKADYYDFFWDLGYEIKWRNQVIKSREDTQFQSLMRAENADIHAYLPWG